MQKYVDWYLSPKGNLQSFEGYNLHMKGVH